MIAAVTFGRRELEELAEYVARERLAVRASVEVASWDKENGLVLRFGEEPEPVESPTEDPGPWD